MWNMGFINSLLIISTTHDMLTLCLLTALLMVSLSNGKLIILIATQQIKWTFAAILLISVIYLSVVVKGA